MLRIDTSCKFDVEDSYFEFDVKDLYFELDIDDFLLQYFEGFFKISDLTLFHTNYPKSQDKIN